MKKVSALFLLVLTLCFVFSCKHEPILPTQQVSFQGDILPILRSSCQHAGCHSPYDPNAQFPLDSVITDIREYVKVDKPRDSKLYETITDSDPSDRMPRPPYEPLTQRQIDLIHIWIAQGAQDN
ncbi:MAG: hypothetical protein M3R17_08750 [Bacteroidota bacterium]|nr:hypothetical protein [Bacteroidota bacterium]